MSKYPSIPEPREDMTSLLATVKALKQTVELLTGHQGTDNASKVYTDQTKQPSSPQKGDLWIGPTGTAYWSGREWVALP